MQTLYSIILVHLIVTCAIDIQLYSPKYYYYLKGHYELKYLNGMEKIKLKICREDLLKDKFWHTCRKAPDKVNGRIDEKKTHACVF